VRLLGCVVQPVLNALRRSFLIVPAFTRVDDTRICAPTDSF